MKRLFTIVLSTIIVAGLYAQGFTEMTTMLEAVRESSVAFADVDGDMDQDVLITGESQAGGRVAKLYKNDGAGQYTEVSTPFLGVVNGSSAFADVDGDMDQDVLITGGILNQQLPFAQLYTNDGSGTFTALTTPIIGVADGAVAFADIDGDTDQDVIVTGRLSDFTQVAKLYVNNGSNQFSEVTTPFIGVRSGSVNFADVDGDMDQDLMITGQTSSGSVASLYINDGNGQFTESSNTFPGVRFSSVAFADVDGDADQDLLLTGQDSNFDRIVKLYTNNGSGQFAEQTGTPFTAATRGSITFADVDGDADQDVIITGDGTGFNNPSTKLYINDGSGQFTEEPNTPFADVLRSSVAFADVNGDFAPDLLITGESNGGNALTKLYANDGFDCVAQIASQTDISCNGGADGAITVSGASGTEPYTYSWSNGGFLATITGVPAGTYTVTVTDAEGCEAIATTTLTEPEPLSITTSTTPESAANVSFDGTASATASGGTPPYSYQWSNDLTGSFIFSLNTGVYNVTVTDANGCTATGTALVGPCAPVVNSINLVDCGNGLSGFVTLEVDGELNGAAQWQWLGLNQDCENPSFIVATGTTITADYFDYINTEFIVRAVGGCLNAPVCFTFVPSDLTGEPAALSLSETTFCQGGGVQTGLGGGSPAGGVYSGPGVTDDGNGMTFSFDPDAVGLGSSTITYTYDTGTACGDSEAEVMIQVGTLPDATFTAPGPFTTDAGLQPLTGGLPAGGTYSGEGVVNNGDGTFSFDPSVGAGAYTITYTFEEGSGCSDTAEGIIEVVIPAVEGAALSFDGTNDRVSIPSANLLSGLDEDYTISAWVKIDDNTVSQPILHLTNSDFSVSVFFAANIIVNGNAFPTIEVRNSNNTNLAEGSSPLSTNEWHHLVVAYDASETTLLLYADGEEVARNESVSLTPADMSGLFTQAHIGFSGYAGVGGYFGGEMDELRITTAQSDCYAVTQQADCELSDDDPSLELYYRFNQNINDPSQTMLEAVAGPNGTLENFAYSGTESNFLVEGAIETGALCDPVTESAPLVTGSGMLIENEDDTPSADDGTDLGDLFVGASQTATFSVINAGPGSTFMVDTIISSNPLFTIMADTDAPVTNLMPINFEVTFMPTAAGQESAVITVVTDDCVVGDYTFTVQGNALPTVAFMAPADLCLNAGVQAGLDGGTPEGGVYSGPGVTDDGNGMTYSFDPAAAGLGIHTITYSLQGATATDDVEVFASPDATFAPTLTGVCADAGVQAGLGGGMPEGGVYSGPGVTDDGNGMTFSFDPAVAGEGTQTVTYTVSSSNIDQEQTNAASATGTFSEVAPLAQSFIPAATQICGAGFFIPSNSESGNMTIALWDALPNATGANMLASGTVAVNPSSYGDVTWAAVDVLPGNTYFLVATGDDGIRIGFSSFNPYTDGLAYFSANFPYQPSTLEDLVFRTFTCSTIPCTAEATADIEVFSAPTVTFTAPGPFTIDDGLQPLTGGMPEGGSYSGTGVADNGDGTFTFDPSIGAGTYTITYTFVDGNGCTGLDAAEITVEEVMLVTGDLCTDAIDINGQFGQAPGEVQTSGPYDNTNATTDDSDPDFGWECFGEPTGAGGAPSLERTLWFTFEGDGNSYFIEAPACGDDPIDDGDTQFVIYAGSNCDSLEAVLCNEDGPNAMSGGPFPAGDTLQTEAGVTYYIMVDGFGPDFPADGEFCVEVTQLAPPVQTAPVTFQVDASGLVENGTLSPEGIFVAGEFNGWPNPGTPMTEGADNIWSVTLEVPANDTFEYKFQNGPDGWENIDETFGDPCTLGDFGNRFVVVEEAAVVTGLVCFNYCVTCELIVGVDENALQAGVKVFPNPARDILNVQLDLPSATESLQIRLLNMLGQEVLSGHYGQLQSDNIELDVSGLPTGAYLIQVRDGKSQFTEPIVIQQ